MLEREPTTVEEALRTATRLGAYERSAITTLKTSRKTREGSIRVVTDESICEDSLNKKLDQVLARSAVLEKKKDCQMSRGCSAFKKEIGEGESKQARSNTEKKKEKYVKNHDRTKDKCYRCGKLGHWSKNCKQRMESTDVSKGNSARLVDVYQYTSTPEGDETY